MDQELRMKVFEEYWGALGEHERVSKKKKNKSARAGYSTGRSTARSGFNSGRNTGRISGRSSNGSNPSSSRDSARTGRKMSVSIGWKQPSFKGVVVSAKNASASASDSAGAGAGIGALGRGKSFLGGIGLSGEALDEIDDEDEEGDTPKAQVNR
jgi:hypothetical protein